jgi:ArsR family transcriptional regulator
VIETTSPPVDLERLTVWLKVLAEPKRLTIFHRIMEGSQCNCILGSDLDIPPNLVSYHLRAMQQAGLLDVQRDPNDARWVYYSVKLEALDELNRALDSFFDPKQIKPRRNICGPWESIVLVDDLDSR